MAENKGDMQHICMHSAIATQKVVVKAKAWQIRKGKCRLVRKYALYKVIL